MDRFSVLSDELLVKILSFLPTKVSVSTSILSKRWEFLWMWLPKLEYGDILASHSECQRLRCFLDRNLPLHKAPIESLSLELSSDHFIPHEIKLWIVIAVSHSVRELEMSYDSHPPDSNILPSNLYTCKSLVTLNLNGGVLLNVPRMVFLPSLKTLRFHHMIYYTEESCRRLLSNSPVLEDLFVHLREEDDIERLTIVSSSLQSLSLYIPIVYNMHGIVINTPSLKYFKLRDHSLKNHYCLIENMPNLIKAYVVVGFSNINSLIGSITSVKHLEICSEAMYDEGFVFNQLVHLKLCKCKGHWSNLLFRLLKNSPNLQVLDPFKMRSHYQNEMVYWNQPSTVPECMLSSLQTLRPQLEEIHRSARRERSYSLHLEKCTSLKDYNNQVF